MLATMRCDPCGKSFTGNICFQQHVESEKHKRKILSLGLSSSSGTCPQIQSSKTTQITLECPVCEIFFDSLFSLQSHSFSPEHAQKILEKNSENNKPAEVLSNPNHINNCEDSCSNKNVYDGASDNILSSNEFIKSQTLSFANCNVCNKIFSGPEPYKQHIESAAHIKKVELEKNAASCNMNQNVQFSCSPCKKTFSGQVPYTQHMESENHRKKMLTLQFYEKETSDIDSASGIEESKTGEINQNNLWFCNICQKQCSGYIPYQQHLNGILHLKNIVKAKRQNCNSNPIDSKQHTLALESKTIGKNTVDASCMVNGGNIQINDDKRNRDVVDYVLHELEDNLKIMSTEELVKSFKIFLPDEAINFDKLDDRKDVNSLNEETCTPEDVKMHEINEKPYLSCKLCNVNLISKEETISHFESINHFLKRWQKN